jgi:hypothetical protein
MKIISLFYCLLLFSNCHFTETDSCKKAINAEKNQEFESTLGTISLIHSEGKTIGDRFRTPKDFRRLNLEVKSFESFLRDLSLKPHGARVQTFNGKIKANDGIYAAVIDLPIGTRDLHQCADAVMRLRADYLWQNNRYNEIHFNFTNGWRADYAEWIRGKRVVLDGNISYWVQKKPASNTYQDYWKYMEVIFSYAGTLSLEKELVPVEIEDMQIGDVFIRGGSPGHAVIVVDMCEHISTGEKLFILAQSYMPAQELQVLQNPSSEKMSPWYSSNFGNELRTPEWLFYRTELKRFREDK